MKHSLITLSVISALAASLASQPMRQLWEFPTPNFIENVAIRPSGELLLNTFDDGRMYILDPNSPDPQPAIMAQFPGASGLTGITELAPDYFAVTGGDLNATSQRYAEGSIRIYTVDFRPNGTSPVIKTVARPANTTMLNGMATLPAYPDIVLSAGSVDGSIYRIDTQTGQVDIVITDPQLAVGDNEVIAQGVNGIKVHREHLYFTVSSHGTYGRVRISPEGERRGPLEILTRIPADASESAAYDDFAIGDEGTAFATLHVNALVKITPDGRQEVIVGGGNSTVLRDPTAAVLSRDQSRLYVVTGGAAVRGGNTGGQVLEVLLQ